MAKLPYEILLRFDDQGNFRAGHTIRRDSVSGQLDPAQPIGQDTDFPWPAVASEVNTAAVARATALEPVATDLAAAQKRAAAAEAQVAALTLPADEAALAAAAAEHEAAGKALEEKRAKLEEKRAKLEEKRAAAASVDQVEQAEVVVSEK